MRMLTITVNGSQERVSVGETESLLDVLRDRLHLTGAKEGCHEGECGACTVLIDGLPVDSCIFSAAASDGRVIETIEGLGGPTALQKALVETGGLQCGFCTPGFVMVLTALLREHPNPTPELVRESLSGNICRCTGYAQIEDAVAKVTQRENGGSG